MYERSESTLNDGENHLNRTLVDVTDITDKPTAGPGRLSLTETIIIITINNNNNNKIIIIIINK